MPLPLPLPALIHHSNMIANEKFQEFTNDQCYANAARLFGGVTRIKHKTWALRQHCDTFISRKYVIDRPLRCPSLRVILIRKNAIRLLTQQPSTFRAQLPHGPLTVKIPDKFSRLPKLTLVNFEEERNSSYAFILSHRQ